MVTRTAEQSVLFYNVSLISSAVSYWEPLQRTCRADGSKYDVNFFAEKHFYGSKRRIFGVTLIIKIDLCVDDAGSHSTSTQHYRIVSWCQYGCNIVKIVKLSWNLVCHAFLHFHHEKRDNFEANLRESNSFFMKTGRTVLRRDLLTWDYQKSNCVVKHH